MCSSDLFFYFAFGDSYTTTGFDINGVQPAPGNPFGNPAYDQTISSAPADPFAGGPNYVGFLATKYNSSYVLAYDFAVGGATITNSLVSSSAPFETQVGRYFEPKYTSPHVGDWNSDNAIFSVFFGINDVDGSLSNGASPADPSTRVPALLDAYFMLCDNLYQQGARRFMFVGVPPLDRSPLIQTESQEIQTEYRDYANDFNGQLAQRITQWAGENAGVVAATYDYHRWLSAVLDDPASLGFPDATCINSDGQSCIWANNYHVGSRLNDALAQRMLPAMNSLGFDGSAPVGGYFY